MLWRFRTGSPWRDLPAEYGPWSTVYDRSWAKAGVFQLLMEAVIAEAAARDQVDLSLVSVDSTTARAHHQAAGMVVDPGLLEELEKAADQEKGLRAAGTRVPPTESDTTKTGVGHRPYADGRAPDAEFRRIAWLPAGHVKR